MNSREFKNSCTCILLLAYNQVFISDTLLTLIFSCVFVYWGQAILGVKGNSE